MHNGSGRRWSSGCGYTGPIFGKTVCFAATFAMLALLLPAALCAQWERLPLYAGHADWLIQNKYKANEIFAVVKYGGIYKSEDYGDTWSTAITDIPHLGWSSIQDFEVSASGQYYAYVNGPQWKVWRSLDRGATWFADTILSEGNTDYFGTIETHPDSSLLITSDFNGTVLRTKDDFLHMEKIRTDSSYWAVWTVFFHPDSSEILFREDLSIGDTRLLRISEMGKVSLTCQFPCTGTVHALQKSNTESSGTFGLWHKEPYMEQYDYYESSDNGLTWRHQERASIHKTIWAWSENIQAWYDVQGVSLLSTIHTLYRSTNGNKTVDSIRNISIWDFLPVKDHLLASTNFDGLMISTDIGLSWSRKPYSRAFGAFSSIEFAAATADTLFAILRDVTYFPEVSLSFAGCNQALLQSNDGGASWNIAARDTALQNLRAENWPSSVYYATRNNNILIRGAARTGLIDTIFVAEGHIVQFENSDIFPNELFIMEMKYDRSYNPIRVHCSTDGGRTWSQFFDVPAYAEEAHLFPSRVQRGAAFLACETSHDGAEPFMGLYSIVDYGKRITRPINTNDHLRMILFGDDILFRKRPDWSFSTDGGYTWRRNYTGLDTVDVARFDSNIADPMFCAGNRLYLPWGNTWLKYMNGRWHKVRDASGNYVSRTMPMALAEVGEYLYSGTQYDGLYRIKIEDPTSSELKDIEMRNAYIRAAPNPFRSATTIQYSFDRGDFSNGVIIVADMLGRTLYRQCLNNTTGFLRWDCINRTGSWFAAGVYIVSLQENGKNVAQSIIYHIR
jgi:hypothetical protein